MSWLRWEEGRQGSGYSKMLLATAPFPVGWDMYLIKFPLESFIGAHKDPVPDKRHFRLNLTLWDSSDGGDFICEPEGIVFKLPRLVLFRPDVAKHSVTEIMKGRRLVLSVGFIL